MLHTFLLFLTSSFIVALLLFFISFAHHQHPLFPDYKRKMFQPGVCVRYISFFRALFYYCFANIVASGWKEWIRALILAEVCSLATLLFPSQSRAHTHELLFFWVDPFQAFSNYPPYTCVYMAAASGTHKL